MLLTIILVGALILISFTYLRGTYNHNYWTKRNVFFYEKSKTGGPFWEFFTGSRSLFEIFRDIYSDCEQIPAVGLGSLFDKALYVKDPINVHHITQIDFHSFNHRGIPINKEDVLANSVLFLNGAKWKLLRKKFSPVFTSAKLKNMYYIIDKSAQDFIEFLKLNPDRLKGNVSSAHDTITHFCTAAISASVFGIGTKSTFDSPFRKLILEAVKSTTSLNFKFAIAAVSDSLFKTLKIKFFGAYEKVFVAAMKQVMRQRESDDINRHDFADMCVKLQKEGIMIDPESNISIEPTDEVFAAQAFFFFIAGIEPCAATMFSTMMELGRNPEILERVHEEVDGVFKKYNNQLTYEAIFEIEYLNRVVNESLRMYPPLGYLSRQCINDTTLPVGNTLIEKGVKVFLPIFDLHYDPKYHKNPEVFDPDRFLRDEEMSDMTYLPFGKGNRICIGARYARMQILSGLVHFLRHYTLKTHVHQGGIQFQKEPVQVRIKNVDIEFIKRNNNL